MVLEDPVSERYWRNDLLRIWNLPEQETSGSGGTGSEQEDVARAWYARHDTAALDKLGDSMAN